MVGNKGISHGNKRERWLCEETGVKKEEISTTACDNKMRGTESWKS